MYWTSVSPTIAIVTQTSTKKPSYVATMTKLCNKNYQSSFEEPKFYNSEHSGRWCSCQLRTISCFSLSININRRLAYM